MKESKVKSVAGVLVASGILLALFHLVGGGLSGGAWVGVAIAVVAAVVGAVRPHQARCRS